MKPAAPRSAARPRIVAIAALVVLGFVLGAIAGGQIGPIRDAVDDVFGAKGQDATSEAIGVIQDDYFHTVDTKDLENASIGSIVDHLKRRYHDRFSHYFTQAEYDRFKQGARFSGVGLGVNEVRRGLRVADGLQAHAGQGGRDPAGRRDHGGERRSDRRRGRRRSSQRGFEVPPGRR